MSEKVCEELNERYDGDGFKLFIRIMDATNFEIVQAVRRMLVNGCFCPSCMLVQLEKTGDES